LTQLAEIFLIQSEKMDKFGYFQTQIQTKEGRPARATKNRPDLGQKFLIQTHHLPDPIWAILTIMMAVQV